MLAIIKMAIIIDYLVNMLLTIFQIFNVKTQFNKVTILINEDTNGHNVVKKNKMKDSHI